MFFLSYVCYAFVRVCFYVPCGHLLGKDWPLGSLLWCLTVCLSLSHCHPGSDVVIECIDSLSLHPYLLCICQFLMLLFLPKFMINVTTLIWNCQFPILDCVFRSTSNEVYISQLIRFARAPSNVAGSSIRNNLLTQKLLNYTDQCKSTGGCYNELVVAIYRTGAGVKNIYLLTLWFIYRLAFILFVTTPGAQTIGSIAVYGSAKQ